MKARKPSPLVGLPVLNLSKLAPDLLAMITRVIHALHKSSPGGAKITPAEWAEIGQAAGVVAVDVVGELVGES